MDYYHTFYAKIDLVIMLYNANFDEKFDHIKRCTGFLILDFGAGLHSPHT